MPPGTIVYDSEGKEIGPSASAEGGNVVVTVGDKPAALPANAFMQTEKGTAITLTSREFAVLEFLIRNKGTVVSKSLILQSIWDENYEGDNNIVEVYIGYLRKRIDAPFGVRSIETVRGAGYRLCEV